MGLTKTEKELNNLSGSVISVAWLIYIYLYSILHSLLVNNFVCQKLFERKLVDHFCLIIQVNGFSVKGLMLNSLLAACLHARNEMESFFPFNIKYVVCFNKIIFGWKRFL